MSRRLTTISLYAGAGGLDKGFIDSGFDVVWANELDPAACKTYEANVGGHIVCADVLTTDPPDDVDVDVVIGGPPCQGFSVIGRMDADDPRSQHVFHFMDVVENVEPSAFVMENVKALGASPRWEPIRRELTERAESLGFTVEPFILNASHYEVPQSRERFFLVGIKGARPEAPPTVTADAPPTVREAFAALPAYGEAGNDGVVRARVVPAADPVMRPTAFRGSLLFNGSGRPLNLDEPAKTLPASMGGNATPIVDQEELDAGADPWVVEYHQRLASGKGPLKRAPKRLRRLTVQEAAALQTMDGWRFSGQQVAQLRQIGNAVPPKLAMHVSRAVRAALEQAEAAETGEPAASAVR